MSLLSAFPPIRDHILAYVSVIFILYFSISSFLTWYPLRNFDGPRFAWLTQLWTTRIAMSGDMHLKIYGVSQKYGDLARIGPKTLLTNQPSTFIYMNRARSPYKRSDVYDGMQVDPSARTIVLELDDVRHDKLRAIMAPGYAGKENPDLESRINARILDLVGAIERKYLSTSTILRRADFANLANFFTLDVISDLAYGSPFGYLEKDYDHLGYIDTVTKYMPVLAFLTTLPWFARFMNRPWVRRITGPHPTDEQGMGKLMGLAREIVAKRFGPDKLVQKDMLGSFIKNGLSQEEAQVEILTQIIAGSDTTAIAIRMTVLQIINNPKVYTKLMAEIDQYLKDNPSKASPDSVISSFESRKLPYLQSCIREGLRIFPPFTGINSKLVPPQGDTINGRFVPGGTRIALSVWAMQRDPIFGNDVDVFIPERWMGLEKEKEQKMFTNMELIFGSGKYGCLGRSVAYIELDKVFFELFRRFDIVLLDPLKPIHTVNMMLFSQWGMWARITRRGEADVAAESHVA